MTARGTVASLLGAVPPSKRLHRYSVMEELSGVALQRFGEYLKHLITTAPRVPEARQGFGDSIFSRNATVLGCEGAWGFVLA